MSWNALVADAFHRVLTAKGGPRQVSGCQEVCRRDEHTHYVNRSPWLRAAVLGANDGLVSVGSLLLGVSAANPSTKTVLLSGISALLAGAVTSLRGCEGT